MQEQDKILVAAVHEITPSRVRDLLCTAFEGGSNYWIDSIVANNANTFNLSYFHEAPSVPEGYVELRVESERLKLTHDKVKKGLQTMAKNHPRHFKNFIEENDDAETGDVFLQCCLFNKVIYG